MSPTHTQAPPLSPRPPPALTAHLEWSSVALKVTRPPGDSRFTSRTFHLEEQSDRRTPVERRQNCTSRSVCSVGATQPWYRSEPDSTGEVRVTSTWSEQQSADKMVFICFKWIVLVMLQKRNPGTYWGTQGPIKETFQKQEDLCPPKLQDLFKGTKATVSGTWDSSVFLQIWNLFQKLFQILLSSQNQSRNLLRNLGTFVATLDPVKEPRKL